MRTLMLLKFHYDPTAEWVSRRFQQAPDEVIEQVSRKTRDVKRVFADIDTDHGDFRITLG